MINFLILISTVALFVLITIALIKFVLGLLGDK